MKAFCASVNLDAFMRFRSSPSQGKLAENSSFIRSSFQGAEHAKQMILNGNGIGLYTKTGLLDEVRAGSLKFIPLMDKLLSDVRVVFSFRRARALIRQNA